MDYHVRWLDAINAYSFVVIGNVAELPKPAGQTNAKALVVVIDQLAAQSRYLERSPLYRCQLKTDLEAVYGAMRSSGKTHAKKLDLLVIDLDLSPAQWLANDPGSKTPEVQCEKDLHQLIIDEATVDEAKKKSYPIRTVLMQPFDKAAADSNTAWQALKATPNVAVGSAALPLEYGLVIKHYCDVDTLAATAFALSAEFLRSRENCVARAIELKREPKRKETEPIDPRKYLAGVVPIAITGDQQSEPLNSRLGGILADTNFAAVFFGAAFGDEDAFATPLGDLYGVEIHAASYLSLLDPLRTVHRLWELLFDIAFGFVFGYFIAWCWKRYFEFKLSGDSAKELYAPFYVLLLTVGVCVIAVALTFFSWILLVRCGIWASPIPMAVGMMLESFVSGSVAQGIDVARAHKHVTPPAQEKYAKRFYGGDESARLLGTRWVIWITVVVSAVLTAVYG